MNLTDILKEILDIANKIEYNTLSYSRAPLVYAKRMANPADSLLAITTRFFTEAKTGTPPSRPELKSALQDLKRIANDYKIKELRKPIEDLKSFIDNLA